MQRATVLCLAIAATVLLPVNSSRAAAQTWTGGSPVDSNWSTNANWSGGAPPTSTNTATFNNNTRTSISLTATTSVGGITFDTASAGAFTIGTTGGNAFSLANTGANAGAFTINTTVVNTETINAPLLLSASAGSTYAFINNSTTVGASLVIGGSVTGQDTAGNTTTLTLGGTNNGSVTGIIGDGSAGGKLAITMSGSGTWILNNASNTYTGKTTITSGILAAGSDSAFGTGTLSLNGGTLQGSGGDRSLSNTVTLDASSIVSGSQNLTLSGIFTQVAGDFTLTNNLDSGKLLTLSNTVNLSNSNTLHTLTFTGTGDTTISGVIANGGTGAGKLVKLGTGTMTLSGANTYTGTTTIGSSNGANAGTLKLSGSGVISNAATTVFGGTFDLNGLIQSITTLTLGGGASGSSATVSVGAGELKLGGNVTYDATNNPNGAAITSTTGKLSLLANRTFTVGDSSAATADLTISAIIQNGDGTARSLTKAGAGTLVLSGVNTYTGGTSINAGVLNLGVAQGGGGGPLGGSGSVDSSIGTISFGGGTLQFSSANQTDYSSRFSEGSGQAYRIDTNNQTVGWGTARSPTGTGTLTKLGAGTLNITTSSNGWTGATTIDGGIINVAALANINTSSSIGKGSAGGSAADLVFGGGTLQYTRTTAATPTSTDRLFTIGDANGLTATLDSSSTTLTNTMSFTNTGALVLGGSGARTLTLTGTNTGSNTFAPIIGDGTGGATSLVKSGAGTWTLSGASTYSGGTTLSAGTLNINNAGSGGTSSAIGTGTFAIGDGTTIDNTSAGAITLSTNNHQNWLGNFTFTGTKDLNLGTGIVGLNDNTRQVTVTAGTLTVGGIISDSVVSAPAPGPGKKPLPPQPAPLPPLAAKRYHQSRRRHTHPFRREHLQRRDSPKCWNFGDWIE